MARRIALVGAMAAACVAAVAASPQAAADAPLTLEAAFMRAADANPALAAARLRRPIDQANELVARERPNPDVSVELERETPRQAYTLSQPLEVGGQRARRIAASAAASRAGDAELGATALDLRTTVRRAYFARVIADARLALLVEQRGLASRARDAAVQRFDAGSAPRLEVLQSELALSQADNDVTTARAASDAARTTLNALLGLPLDAATPLATPLDPTPLPSREQALARARSGSAALAVLDAQVTVAAANVALARAERMPDVIADATVTHSAEPDFDTGWRAGATVTVPLFTRHNAAVAVEQATLAQATAERVAAAADLDRDVTTTLAVAEASRRAYLQYRDQMLSQAAAIEQMADDSYRLGQTGLAAYLLALESTRDARLRALQAAADYHNAVADLEHAMGTPLP